MAAAAGVDGASEDDFTSLAEVFCRMFSHVGFAAVILSSLVNALPSPTALRPFHAVCDLNEGDLTGSGRESRDNRTAFAASAQGDGDGGGDEDEGAPDERAAAAAREWRAMAARCRNLACWQNEESRAVLLRLAEEYEARALRAERSGKA